MSLSTRIKQRREELGYTQPELAKLVGVSKGSIGNYESGISSPNENILIKLFAALKCDANYLYQDEIESMKGDILSASEREMIKKYRMLDAHGKKIMGMVLDEEYTRSITPIKPEKKQPMYSIRHSLYKVSAGIGFMLDDNNAWETISVPDSPEARQADFALTISGDSMEPIYYDGDVVLVEQCDALDEGEVGVYIVNGDGYIKKYGVDRLISLNEKYKDIKFSQYDTIKCVGRVIGRV